MEEKREVWMCDCGRSRKSWVDPARIPLCLVCGSALKPEGQLTLKNFSVVPFEVEVKDSDQKRILDFLFENKGLFFKASDIALRLGIKKEKTQVNVRKAVLLLISEGFPVVSTAKGFGFVDNRSQVEAYIANLEARRSGLDLRISKLRLIFDKMEEKK